MPFDFKKYDEKCQGMDHEELQREWQHYTRLISGASTSTAVSGLALPLTAGVSVIGVGLAAPAIHNARKKRDIIERHLNRLGTTHSTRKRDVFSGVAVSGTIGVVTLGVGTAGADAVATAGAEAGISSIVENETAIKIVTHAALDGAGMGLEHMYTHHVKAREAQKAFEKAGVFQAVANAKAQEAGYVVPPYGAHTQNAGSSSMAQAPYEPDYGPQMAPPPPYSAAAAPAGFVSDAKTPAVAYTTHTQQPPPPVYGYGVPGQPQHGFDPQRQSFLASVPQPGYTAPAPYGQDQAGLSYSAQQIGAQNQNAAQTQAPRDLAYNTPAVATPTYDPNPAGDGHGLQAAQAPPVELGRNHAQSPAQGQDQDPAWPGPQTQQHTQQQTPSQPQISTVPALHSPPQAAPESFDMNAMVYSLPAPTPAPEHQPYQQHQQQQQQQTQHQQEQYQYQNVAVYAQPESQPEPQARSQSVSYPHLEHSTGLPTEPSAQAAVTPVPETPTLHAPKPTIVHNPVSGLAGYTSQPTPALQQCQQAPPQTVQPSSEVVGHQPPQHPTQQPDMQYYPPQAVEPPRQTLHQSAPQQFQYPQSSQPPAQPEVQQQQYTPQPPAPQAQPQPQYQTAYDTYTSPLQQQQKGPSAAVYQTAVPPPPLPSVGMPQPPPPSLYQQPSTPSSYSSSVTNQRPASMIYFPPPPTAAAPKTKHAPPPPAQPALAHRFSLPPPPPSTAPPSAVQGYTVPGVPYTPAPFAPTPQPPVQQQPHPPRQYQYTAYQQPYQQPQAPTPQPPPQQYSYPAHAQQHQPHQPQQAVTQQYSYPSYPQQQAPPAQQPQPAQFTAFPPTPLSPPQSAQNTGPGYFPVHNPQQQQQQTAAQCPPGPQQWSAQSGYGQSQWPAQAPYTPAATPAWTGH